MIRSLLYLVLDNTDSCRINFFLNHQALIYHRNHRCRPLTGNEKWVLYHV